MLGLNSFENDPEFQKLMVRDPDVDLTVACLELAREFDPGIDFNHTQEWLRVRAREIMTRVARCTCDREILRILAECLGATWGIHGTDSCYEESDSSFIHRVIETRRGIPIATSAIYMGVARYLGVDLRGVSAPMHFLTRLDADEGPLFVDGFASGRIMSFDETVEMLELLTSQPREVVARYLEPADNREIVIRMLRNLKTLFCRQEKWDSAWRIQHRLTALTPGSYREHRDLALVSVRAHRPGFAIGLLKRCLAVCPDGDRPVLKQSLAAAQKATPLWN